MINKMLSDLFFNHQHPVLETYLTAMRDKNPVHEEIEAAVLMDAEHFLAYYGQILTTSAGPAKLARDYMDRL